MRDMSTPTTEGAVLNHPENTVNVILVAWSYPDDEGWKQVASALSETLQGILQEPHEPFKKVAQRILGNQKEVKVLYSLNDLDSVEATILTAIEEGATEILVVPLIFALEMDYRTYGPQLDILERLRELEARHSGVRTLFTGPPFGSEEQIANLLERIREEQPKAASRLQSVVTRGFQDNWSLFTDFMRKLQAVLPVDTRVAIRGSTVTGFNYVTGDPFDALGPGTSDLDMVLVGEVALAAWAEEAFYIPKVLTMPLSDEHPEFAPGLETVRRELQNLVERPVHFQAMTHWFLELRRGLLNMPYLYLDA